MTDPRHSNEPPAGLPPYERPRYEGPPPTGAYPPPPQYPSDPYGPNGQYPGYPPYPYGYLPGYPQANPRPGNVLAAAVLGYVNGGLLIIAGLMLFFGASFIANFDNYSGVSHSEYISELAVNGVGNLLAAGLLIGGGISLTGRGATGRVLYAVGAVIVLIEAIYWLVRWSDRSGGAVVVYAIIFAGLAVVGCALAWTGPVTAWLHERGTG